MSDPTKPYRVAMREEGAMVNLYWTRAETMVGAELVGSFNRELCYSAPEIGQAFKMLAGIMAAELCRVRLGVQASAIEHSDAPEHERAGNA